MIGAAGHKNNWSDSACLPSQDIHELLLSWDDGLAVERSKRSADFQLDLAYGVAFISENHPPRHRVRFRNPEFGCDVQAFDGNKIQRQKVWIEAAH